MCPLGKSVTFNNESPSPICPGSQLALQLFLACFCEKLQRVTNQPEDIANSQV